MAFKIGTNEVIDNSGITTGTIGGTVVQTVSHTTLFSASGNFGGSTNPGPSSGTQMTAFNFTPVNPNSKILITSSNVTIYENANSSDTFWMAAFYDSTRAAISYTPVRFTSFSAGGENVSVHSFNNVFDSWGTGQKNIQIRVGADGAGNSMVCNRDTAYPQQHDNPEIVFTLIEFSET